MLVSKTSDRSSLTVTASSARWLRITGLDAQSSLAIPIAGQRQYDRARPPAIRQEKGDLARSHLQSSGDDAVAYDPPAKGKRPGSRHAICEQHPQGTAEALDLEFADEVAHDRQR